MCPHCIHSLLHHRAHLVELRVGTATQTIYLDYEGEEKNERNTEKGRKENREIRKNDWRRGTWNTFENIVCTSQLGIEKIESRQTGKSVRQKRSNYESIDEEEADEGFWRFPKPGRACQLREGKKWGRHSGKRRKKNRRSGKYPPKGAEEEVWHLLKPFNAQE